ncbi:(3S,6E)-nerolidol synthase 1-like [Quercus suber]|uniref:(3S,6E)-nerolidol synthase 1-like n=1 Tax=Quercus suber TaxID=58331 RepID=UPI0032E050F2
MVCFWELAKSRGVHEECTCEYRIACGANSHVLLLGEGISKETVDLLDNNPCIISSTATILRLWDDLGSAQDEDQNGHDGSYAISSVENAQRHVNKMISNTWKCLNKDCLKPNPFPASFIKASLNAARMVPLMYSYDDKLCLPSLEEHMKSLISERTSGRHSPT